MRALVISGGGAKGAWGGGVSQALHEIHNKSWDLFIGCSTGSLLVTTIPSEEFDLLKEMYTSVNNDSIFSVNPFTNEGKLKKWNALWRIIRGKTSLGESGKLKKILKKHFTEKDYYDLRLINKLVLITVTNVTTGKVEYFSSMECEYNDFIDAVIASTSVPPIMDTVTIKGDLYLDGGIMEHVPLTRAIEMGAKEVDVIVHRPETYPDEHWSPRNMFDVITRSVDLLQREVSTSDVLIGELLNLKQPGIEINFYYTPRILTDNSLVFNEAQMTRWWIEGYKSVAEGSSPVASFISHEVTRGVIGLKRV